MHLGNRLPKIGNLHNTNHDDQEGRNLINIGTSLEAEVDHGQNLGKVVTSVVRLDETAWTGCLDPRLKK